MSDMSDLRAALAGRFRTVVRVPSFACPKEGTKKKIPSSAPASPVHSDAHVKAMRQKTHIAFAMFKHFAAPAPCAGLALPLRVYVASATDRIQRGRPRLGSWAKPRGGRLMVWPNAAPAEPCLYLQSLQSRRRRSGCLGVWRTAPARPVV